MRLQYFPYDRFRTAYLLGVEVKHIISEIGLREITGGQSSSEDQGHSSAKVVSSPLVDMGLCTTLDISWCSLGLLGVCAVSYLVYRWLSATSSIWLSCSLPSVFSSLDLFLSLFIVIMPCRLFVAQYLYNIHMRWLQYLRERNSKYIDLKG